MSRTRAKHNKSEFNRVDDGEPSEIRAHADCIQMDVFFEGEEEARTVYLRPKHISAISSMNDDWWDSHWAAVHEEEA